MYGNHFDNISDKMECLLLPKLLSLNNPHFHFNQCNFSKRNMYTRYGICSRITDTVVNTL